MSINKVILLGNLGHDVSYREFENGQVAHFVMICVWILNTRRRRFSKCKKTMTLKSDKNSQTEKDDEYRFNRC